jgi:hydrogenase maturation protease
MTAPILVFGWGNPSRGDDALGPLFVQSLRNLAANTAVVRVDFLEDFQLQVEHALDLQSRQRVLFVDASVSCAAPFQISRLRAARDNSFTTHAISPESVMQAYHELYRVEPPPCTLLAIRGLHFELGEPPRPAALHHLAQALDWAEAWLLSDTPGPVHADLAHA